MSERTVVRTEGPVDAVGGVFIGLASLQFGAVVVLGKIITTGGLPVPSFLAVRFSVATLVLALALSVIRQPLRAARGEGWRLVALGIAGYAVEAAFFFLAIKHGTAAAVTVLFFTYPVWVALFAVATGRGVPGWLVGAALAATVAGAAVVALSSGGLAISGAGVAFALASAVTFALYLTIVDVVVKRTNSLTGSMWVSGAASVAFAAFVIATVSGDWPSGARQWLPVVGTGVFTAGAFVCLFAGLRRLGAVRTSVVAASEPLAASALAVVFLHEPLRPGTVAGGVLILAGAVAASLARRGPAGEPPMP